MTSPFDITRDKVIEPTLSQKIFAEFSFRRLLRSSPVIFWCPALFVVDVRFFRQRGSSGTLTTTY